MTQYTSTIDELESLIHACSRNGIFCRDEEYVAMLAKLLSLRLFVEASLEENGCDH